MQVTPAITTVGGYVPECVVSNLAFQTSIGVTDEWIVEKTGIKERRILTGKHVGTSAMAIHAVKELCLKRGIQAADIDVLICATVTPDMLFPCTSNLVCHAIGATNALSFDLLAACSGFVYALETGANFIRSGKYQKVVVVGADKMSGRINQLDKQSSFIFGDGAGAVLLERATGPHGLIDTILRSNGDSANLLNLKLGGSLYPFTDDSLAQGHQYFYQNGKHVYKHAVTCMVQTTRELLARNQLHQDDVDYFIPHQSNRRIIEAVTKELHLDPKKVLINIEKYGNTTAASIPLCLWEYEHLFNPGDKIILIAFGGGFTWGSTFLTWAA